MNSMKRTKLPLAFICTILLWLTACQTGDQNQNEQIQDDLPPIPDTTKTVLPSKTSAGFTEDYINTNRLIWQKPDMVIELLGDLSDKVIADIGAGTGFFTMRLAPKAQKVIAIDIDPRFINYLDSVKVMELPENIQDHMETRLGDPNDPKLAPEEVDVVVIVNTFMWIKNKTQYLSILRQGIKKGGKLLIIDFKKKRTPIGPYTKERIPLFEVEEKLYEAGFTNIQTNDTALDYQYIVIAETPE